MHAALACTLLVPIAAAAAGFLAGVRAARWIALAAAAVVDGAVVVLIRVVLDQGIVQHRLGGWGAPLGIELALDGVGTVMLIMTAVVCSGIAVYALGYFGTDEPDEFEGDDRRRERSFWPLLLMAWAGLDGIWLSRDLFNLYVMLEVTSLASVALVSLNRTPACIDAALRYLLVALAGSLLYLMGVALLYARFGVLDATFLAARLEPDRSTSWALILMTVGLGAKAAVLPMHGWLPPAHSSAPAPVSALLSGLIVKAPFFVTLRLWTMVFPAAISRDLGLVLAGCGLAGVAWGSAQAIRQPRLKPLIAYSTIAQMGYLYLFFALAGEVSARADALRAVVVLAIAHACAKASLFFAAGAMRRATGHDELERLRGIAVRQPMATMAFALAGCSIMGLPPTGGFMAKWMLGNAALESGHWWVLVTLLAGGLLAAAYILRVVACTISTPHVTPETCAVPRIMPWCSLALAVLSVVVGLAAPLGMELLDALPLAPLSTEATP
jgi:formate hydrogenlyase subunit 3/multisubunit Na+/H+ antiporter MnhD subunit